MTQPDIASKVIREIETQQVTMRPHWHFLLNGAASVLGILALSGLTVYLVNIITLTIRIQTINRPMFGARQHLSDLLAGFPWWLAFLAALAIGGLIWLLRRNSRLYRIHLGWAITLVITISVLLGLLVSISPLNNLHSGSAQNPSRAQQWRH